jgi:hypothetical protein
MPDEPSSAVFLAQLRTHVHRHRAGVMSDSDWASMESYIGG